MVLFSIIIHVGDQKILKMPSYNCMLMSMEWLPVTNVMMDVCLLEEAKRDPPFAPMDSGMLTSHRVKVCCGFVFKVYKVYIN